MKGIAPLLALTFALSPFLASCGDDPELVAKRDKQKAEISRLRGELNLIELQLESMPPDVSDELADARAKFDANKQALANLESEVDSLTKQKREVQSEFDSYRIKYQVK